MVTLKTFDLSAEEIANFKPNYFSFLILVSETKIEKESDILRDIVVGKYSCDTEDKDSIFYNKNDSLITNLGLECAKIAEDRNFKISNPDFPVISSCEGHLFSYKQNTIPYEQKGRITANDISNINYLIKIFDSYSDYHSAMCNINNCLNEYLFYDDRMGDGLYLNAKALEKTKSKFVIEESKKKFNFDLFDVIVKLCWPLLSSLDNYDTDLYDFIQDYYINITTKHVILGGSNNALDQEYNRVISAFKDNDTITSKINNMINNANAMVSYINALKDFSKTIQPYEKILLSYNSLPDTEHIKGTYILGTLLRILDEYKNIGLIYIL